MKKKLLFILFFLVFDVSILQAQKHLNLSSKIKAGEAPGGVSSNLQLWLDAGNGTTTSGSNLDQWLDRSVNSKNYITGAIKPSLVQNGINYNSSINFAGNESPILTSNSRYSNWTCYFIVEGQNYATSTWLIADANFHINYETYNNTGKLGIDVQCAGDLPVCGNYASSILSPFNSVSLLSFNHASTNNNIIIKSLINATLSTTTLGTGNADRKVAVEQIAHQFQGKFSEVILFDVNSLTTNDTDRVESYLAVKYGLTLDQSSPRSYVASDGTTLIWNATTASTYNKDIVCVGRDDSSGLNQKQSKSANSDDVLIGSISTLLATDNLSNGGSFSNDRSFISWSNNDTDATISWNTNTNFLSNRVNYLSDRVWKFQRVNNTEDLTLFVSSSITFANGTERNLVVSSDGVFDGIGEVVYDLSLDGGYYKKTFTSSELPDGAFVALGAFGYAPGGIVDNVNFWLRGDIGPNNTTNGGSITGWMDSSINGYSFTDSGAGGPKFSTTRAVNFNPSVEYNGLAAEEMNSQTAMVPSGPISIHGVAASDIPNALTLPMVDLAGTTANAQNPSFGFDDNDLTIWDRGTGTTAWNNNRVVAGVPCVLATQFTHNISGISVRHNGFNVSTGTTVTMDVNSFAGIGGPYDDDTRVLNGFINEVVLYTRVLNATEINQLDSYFALKYGITLDQASPKDYIASNSSVKIWDATLAGSYNKDIAGIGRDDISLLNQKQSRSIETDDIMIGSISSTIGSLNSNNSGTFDNDISFISWSNNDADALITWIDNPNFVSNSINQITDRVWKFQRINNTQDVTLAVPNSFSFSGNTIRKLIVSNDGVFDGTGETVFNLTADGSYYKVTLTNAQLSDGVYVALGAAEISPGGVNTNLSLWNRADLGVSTSGTNVTAWQDQTSTNTFTITGGPQYNDNTMNFNPVIGFNGSSYFSGNTVINNQTEFFAVGKIVNNAGTAVSGAMIGNKTIVSSRYAFHSEGGNLYSSGNDTGSGFYIGTNAFGTTIDRSIFNCDLSEVGAVNQKIKINGKSYTNSTASDPAPFSYAPTLGSRLTEPLLSGSEIAEAIIFNVSKNGTERQRVLSYLALKYGISIDQTVSQDYLASDGSSIMWKASDNVGYTNNIFGLGRDDTSLLDQKVSKSIHANSILTLSIDNDFVSSNLAGTRTTEFTTDLQFLVLSDNNGAITMNSTAELDPAYNLRIQREWKVDKTANFTQNISLKFDGFNSTSGVTYYVLRDADGDFSSGSTLLGALDTNGELWDVSLNDGEYLTVVSETIAPGGVALDLQLWLKADKGTNTVVNGANVISWVDQSINGVTTTGITPPNFVANVNNFNHAINFDRVSSEYIDIPDGYDNFTNGTTVYVVAKTKNNNSYERFIDLGLGQRANNILFGRTGITNNMIFEVFNGETGNQFNTTSLPIINNQLRLYGAINIGGVSGTNTTTNQYADGKLEATGLATVPNTIVRTQNFIGKSNWAVDSFYEGEISEVILYNSDHGSNRQKIESYLGIKYGITLDQSTSQNYIASNSSVIWDATVAGLYNKNIFGLGRDDVSELNQKVSKSINSNSILTLSVDNDFILANNNVGRTLNHDNNLQFLVLSDNNGAITMNSTAELDPTYNLRIQREWKVDKTANFTQNISLKFDGFNSTSGVTYYVLRDADGDFSSGSTLLGALDTNGELWDVSLNDGEYLTLAEQTFAPGGVTTQLNMWLRADTGIAAADGANVTTWEDQSNARVNDATNSGELSSPTYRNSGVKRINFNPSVEFNGVDNGLNFGTDYIFTPAANNGVSIFAAAQPDVTSATKIVPYVFDFGFYANRGYGMGIGSHRIHTYSSTDFGGTDTGFSMSGTSEPNIYDVDINFGSTHRILLNNSQVASAAITLAELNDAQIDQISTHTSGTGPMTIGRQAKSANLTSNGNRSFDGLLGEFIHYSADLSVSETLRVNSYLAIKYGITINQTVATNYLGSNGTTIWDATTAGTYNKNIFGIGRDDVTVLHQRISKSVNADGIVTISTDNDFTSNNVSHTDISENFNYLIAADNGLNTNFEVYSSSLAMYHMNKIWKVDKTGTAITTVNIKVDNTDADYLIVSSDPTFDSADVLVPLTTGSFQNVSLADGDYFTFASSVCYEDGIAGAPSTGQNMIISTFDPISSQSWIGSVDNGMLILGSKTKGFVLTRMASPETAITNPIEGMLVFDTDDQVLKLYNGTSWVVLKQKCH